MKFGKQGGTMNGWCWLVALFLVCSFPAFAKADIAGDIKGGMTASAAAQKAINDGMDPVVAALAAAKADPQMIVIIAGDIAKDNPESAKDIAAALARFNPDKAAEIAKEVAKDNKALAAAITAAVIQQVCPFDGLKKYDPAKKNLEEICQNGFQVLTSVLSITGVDKDSLYAALSGVSGGNASPEIEAYEERGQGRPANPGIPLAVLQDVISHTPAADKVPASRR